MSQRLHTGAVTVLDEHDGVAGFPGSGVVGAPPQVDDDTDATYAGVAFGDAAMGNGTSANDFGYVVLDQLASAATDFVTALRVSATEVGGVDNAAGVTVNVHLPGFSSVVLGGLDLLATFGEVPVSGVVAAYTFSIHDLVESLIDTATADAYVAELATWLAAGAQPLRFEATGTYATGDYVAARVYLLQITGVGGALPVYADPHLVRRYPVDTARRYPPTRAGRRVGGYR